MRSAVHMGRRASKRGRRTANIKSTVQTVNRATTIRAKPVQTGGRMVQTGARVVHTKVSPVRAGARVKARTRGVRA